MSVAMTENNSSLNKKIHPHKFTLWVAMGSIVMMFAGLTSAYIVKKSQSAWLEFNLPVAFYYSTVVILLSSLTIYLAKKSFLAREMQRYRFLITLTAVLGFTFVILQYVGFNQLQQQGIQLFGIGSNPAASFLGIITGLHMLHVLGGVIALIIIFLQAFSRKVKNYSTVTIEVASTYWHFVDILWIYLLIFFVWVS